MPRKFKDRQVVISGRSMGGCNYLSRVIKKLNESSQQKVKVIISAGHCQLRVLRTIKRQILDLDRYLKTTTGVGIDLNIEIIRGRGKPRKKGSKR